MKYHHQQESTSKYLLAGIVAAMLATTLLSDPANLRTVLASAETALGNLLHILFS